MLAAKEASAANIAKRSLVLVDVQILISEIKVERLKIRHKKVS